MSLKAVAAFTHLGWDAVKDIVKSDLAARYAEVSLKGVSSIAIDEVYLGKRDKYVTLVINLEDGRVLWVHKGRGAEALQGFWERLGKRGRDNIECVACDMSAAYWSAVQEHLPKAALVFDRFHIVKLANESIDEVRRGIQNTLDLTGRKAVKGKRYLLLHAKENLKADAKAQLDEALKWNEPLSKAYYLKEDLRELWSQPGHAEACVYLQAWIVRARHSGLRPFERLALTLLAHAKSVLNYFHHRITSGKMEGINNKVGRLTRMAYGYRDTEFLHLKIYSLHESAFFLSGV
jgi:transposase